MHLPHCRIPCLPVCPATLSFRPYTTSVLLTSFKLDHKQPIQNKTVSLINAKTGHFDDNKTKIVLVRHNGWLVSIMLHTIVMADSISAES